MRKIIVTLLFLLELVVGNNVFAFPISMNECYIIDGVANVRSTPNGKVAAELADGVVVRVRKKHKNNWYKIVWSTVKDDGSCPIQGSKNSKEGWTYVNNLLPISEPLVDLVTSGRAVYAEGSITTYGYDNIKLLGRSLPLECESESICSVVIQEPYEVTIYCLSGERKRDRIESINVEYGGDGGSWLTSIELKNTLPGKRCLIVDGNVAIADGEQVAFMQARKVDIKQRCEERVRLLKERYNWDSECKTWIGDIGNDGQQEAMVHFKQLTGAPIEEDISLYHYLGNTSGYKYGLILEQSSP